MASTEDVTAYEELTHDVYAYGNVSLALAMAHETGIVPILCQAQAPLSAHQLAQQGNLKERYTSELLKALAAAELLELEKGTGDRDGKEPRYFVPQQHRPALTRAGASSLLTGFICKHYATVKKCIPLDGPDNVEFDHEHDVDLVDQMTAAFMHNTTAAILKTPGLKQLLESGIEAAEVGCGSGRMARHLAAMFPKSHFTVSDLTPRAVDHARQLAQEAGLSNLTFHVLDLCKTPEDWKDRFQWLLASEMVHHVPDPLLALKNVWKALKPGGHFSLVDEFVSTYVARNVGNKDAAALLAMNSLTFAPSGHEHGLGPCWGEEKARELLDRAGFRVLGLTRSGTTSLGSSAVCMCQKPE